MIKLNILKRRNEYEKNESLKSSQIFLTLVKKIDNKIVEQTRFEKVIK